jgi:hypothetical protein
MGRGRTCSTSGNAATAVVAGGREEDPTNSLVNFDGFARPALLAETATNPIEITARHRIAVFSVAPPELPPPMGLAWRFCRSPRRLATDTVLEKTGVNQ